MNKYIVEFIGTFFLLPLVGCTVLAGYVDGVTPSLAIGSTVMESADAGGIQVHILALLAVSALAAVVFKFMSPREAEIA